MNLLFAHDHIFYESKNIYYSNGGLSRKVLERYTSVFENVNVVTRQQSTKNIDNLTLASTKNVKFTKVPNFKSAKSLLEIFEARRIIKNQVLKADCLIARLPSMIGNIAIYYARKYKKPYLVEVVGCAWDASWNYGSLQGKLIAPYSYLKNRNAIKKSNYTIYITKQFLQNRYPSKGYTSVCPNVNIENISFEVLEARKNMIKSNNGFIKFGLIGSLDVNYKGHETVLKALSLVREEIPNFKIEFLGKGNTTRWESLVKQYSLEKEVEFIGTLPSGKGVYTWLDSIDISLQPSTAEAQGRSIIEAMSRGCPVISSKVGGIVELIEHDWLITPKDYRELAIKIKNMVNNKEIQIEQAQRNFDEAKFYYELEIETKRKEFLEKFKCSF